MTMASTHTPPVRLASGTVHRVLVDLVQVGLWAEHQAEATRDCDRRRQLHTTNLACRLAAEVVSEALMQLHLVRSHDDEPRPPPECDGGSPTEPPLC